MPALQPQVAVIGGGCAGLAAAAHLAQHDIPVTLFEASPYLGGRARAVPWKGMSLDNGQHILLGAYSETLRLLELAGKKMDAAFLRIPLRLHMHDELSLKALPLLPAPLHILSGFLVAKGLSLRDRLAAIRFMAWMARHGFQLPHDETLHSLLQRKQQSGRLTRLLWEPLCLAALNTPVAQASAQVFLNVLRDSFAGDRAASDMLLPKCDLSNLLAEPLAAYIEQKGGRIRLGASVTKLSKSRQFEVETEDRDQQLFSHVVLATSPFRLASLLTDFPHLREVMDMVAQFQYQPIYTVYLQYPETAQLDIPMMGFAGTDSTPILSQWIFDRGRLCSQPGLLAVVISAEGPHQELTQQALAKTVTEELSKAFPSLPEPLWHKVIAEKRATFACKPDLPRPRQKTQVPGLYLAGDYTTDGITANLYPATIEGAVRSGVQCAEDIWLITRR
jgi:squalene-associated FAD-dependent desaturase